MTQTVVITGASAGIGRATAQLYGRRGASVALVARGRTGLDAAARDVELAGGKALAVPTDVADYDQVKEASRRTEDAFGPIDVWINVAFTSVFAPFWEITAEEFKRVTEVSYLGFVYGTRVALELMKPRDRGTIVQVGSRSASAASRSRAPTAEPSTPSTDLRRRCAPNSCMTRAASISPWSRCQR